MTSIPRVQQLPLFVLSRICRKCGIEKPLDEFYKQKGCLFDRCATCKQCTLIRMNNRKANPAPRVDANNKTCTRCGINKPLDAFSPEKRGRYGKRSNCKQCILEHRWLREKGVPPPIKPVARAGYRFCSKCGEERLYPLEFATKSNQCKTCKSAYNKARYPTSNKKEQARIRRNSPEGKVYNQTYRQATAEKYQEPNRKRANVWRKAHPERRRESSLRRNALKRRAIVETVDYEAILKRDGYHCYLCNQPIDPSKSGRSNAGLTFDHKVPLVPRPGEPQGTHTADNIHPAHRVCNSRKQNIPFECLTDWHRRGI